MSLTENSASNMVMPVGPMGGLGAGNGMGWGDGSFWIIVLFLFALMGGGVWGNGSGGSQYAINSDLQRGFDQAAVTSGITDISAGLCSGFAGVQQSLCNGFAQSEIAANSRQMADMNQQFAIQSAIQNGCYDNRASIADLKYTLATEACQDRQSVTNALFDVTSQNNANTTALMNAMNNGFQSIKDQMCSDKIAAKDDLIAELRQRVAMQDLAASQASQTGQLIADNTAQTQYIVNRVAPYPIPSYQVASPYNVQTGYGCGCGVA